MDGDGKALIIEAKVLRVTIEGLQHELDDLIHQRGKLERRKLSAEAERLANEIFNELENHRQRLKQLEVTA